MARAATDCADLVPAAGELSQPMHALVPMDLVRLRDIGPVDPTQQYGGLFTVSPDGHQAAFQLRRGDPATNSFCVAMLVVELRPRGKIQVVDRGGDFLRFRFDLRGMADFPSGVADTITPRWSPDGRWIVYRRRDEGAVQLWRARVDGSGSEAITDSADNIDDFRFTADGSAIVYATRPGLREAKVSIDQEGRSGFHYDDRFSPTTSTRPFTPAPVARAAWVIDLQSRRVRAATPNETARLDVTSMQEGQWVEAVGPGGATAMVQVSAKTSYPSRGRLAIRKPGHVISCDAAECADARYPWWTSRKVNFLRYEGWKNSETAIYQWTPGTGGVHRLYRTDDVLIGCVPSGYRIDCLREGARQPRRLERLDPASGKRTIVFDPNPEFTSLTLGRVERLHSTNSFGLPSFADLVLPIGYVRGKNYPLVVVQYSSRGFLRGGTGDDYPIQAFANRGFAVLSIDKPVPVGMKAAPDYVEADRINLKDFADRRSVLEAIETPVRLLIARGIADPQRIGLTGLSDGASSVQFALLHSNLFSAYAISNCCWDTSMPVRVGPGAAKQFATMGYPGTTDESAAAKAFWRQIAISPNARTITAPILAQVPDDEMWGALQSFTVLREQRRPIDLYVFPDEHHVKWQPAHRLAVYARSIDWFDYWLNGAKATNRASEVAHWEALRRECPACFDVSTRLASKR
ncbi:Atxe2 family lasso peptide isopeptidase [Sphingomonas glacialis]|nr:Atxe2 family lasso peptide isopeptidase [Sphingomonas glacialis]